jgi:hypothetical protein
MGPSPEIGDDSGEREFAQALEKPLFLGVFQVGSGKMLDRTLKEEEPRLKGGLDELPHRAPLGKDLVETRRGERGDSKPGMKVATPEIQIRKEDLFSFPGIVEGEDAGKKGFSHPSFPCTYGDDPGHDP